MLATTAIPRTHNRLPRSRFPYQREKWALLRIYVRPMFSFKLSWRIMNLQIRQKEKRYKTDAQHNLCKAAATKHEHPFMLSLKARNFTHLCKKFRQYFTFWREISRHLSACSSTAFKNADHNHHFYTASQPGWPGGLQAKRHLHCRPRAARPSGARVALSAAFSGSIRAKTGRAIRERKTYWPIP
jgi:hypothetical protein